MKKYVYSFKEGNKDMKNILGGKGANLAEMTHIGLPIPQGFIISTEACLKYYEDNMRLSDNLIREIEDKITELENYTNKKFGDLKNPLLLSIRSGARASMPGMMDTVLNLGLNDEVAHSFSKITNNPRFVYDSYRRFIQMFADVVMEIPKSSFERLFDKIKEELKIKNDSELKENDLKEIVKIYKEEYQKLTNKSFPQNPNEQLYLAIQAVFKSWNNERAITYRRINDIPSNWGTAVNIQEMVYGNLNDLSGTGVAFTRNPSTGEAKLYGEYLINAQGEDVVAG
ncbi:MAG: PEP/pyruvate-binding domain-containing protein, partial [Tissierellia bacterium]|nr:PEP/pyruvate-binding domain-containing protein [Tissierellia bacterium]